MLTILADENMPLVEGFFADFAWIDKAAGRDISRSDLEDTKVLLVRSITQVNKELLQNTPVQFVGSATIGTDHIDQAYLKDQNIEFAYSPGCNAQAVAEYVLAAIAFWANKHNVDLHAVTVGIIGAGNVGSKVTQMLELLNIKYLLNDPLLKQADDSREFVDLEAINHCDIVTCHVPLTIDGDYPTKHLIDSDFMNGMHKGALFINSSRGAVLDNKAALEVLNHKEIDLVLDVWENEPELDIELLDKVLLATPHIAGYTLEGKIRGTYMLYRQIRQWLGKEALITLESKLPHTKLWQPPKYIADLHDSLKPFYDIEEDDQSLRTIAHKKAGNLSQDFDALRKNYKTRLEYWR